jgi:hypothetical protein
MVNGLVGEGVEGRYRDYAGAEQATMAIAGLLDFLAKRGALADVRGANRALDRVYETVKSDERFKPETFREALAALGRTLGT